MRSLPVSDAKAELIMRILSTDARATDRQMSVMATLCRGSSWLPVGRGYLGSRQGADLWIEAALRVATQDLDATVQGGR